MKPTLSIIKGGQTGSPIRGSRKKVKDTMSKNDKVVKIVRFISGEEIITTIVNLNEKKIVIEKPLVMVYKPSSEGQVAIGFGPFMPYTESQIALNMSAVAAIADPVSKIVEEYDRLFSPIIQPSPSIVSSSRPMGPVGPILP